MQIVYFQVDDAFDTTSPLHTSDMPLVTLLGLKPKPDCK